MRTLDEIIDLEESENYISAFDEYQKCFSLIQDFELWKHYYFFLWYITVEDLPLKMETFVAENKLEIRLKEVGLFGIEKFNNNPEALFVLGYTISLFPYYFGEYEKFEHEAEMMLEKAHNIQPNDIIYKLAYLGSTIGNEEAYKQVCVEAAPKVMERFNGKGLLNNYFREVLYRVKASQ
jgi:hypothetical protein